MLCCETGNFEAVKSGKAEMTRVDALTVDDARDIGNAVKAVRSVDHGNGELCIPFINGFFDKIRISILSYRNKKARLS